MSIDETRDIFQCFVVRTSVQDYELDHNDVAFRHVVHPTGVRVDANRSIKHQKPGILEAVRVGVLPPVGGTPISPFYQFPLTA